MGKPTRAVTFVTPIRALVRPVTFNSEVQAGAIVTPELHFPAH